MDLTSEKAEIVKRFEQVNDASLIQAIKSLLDFAQGKTPENNEALESSINKGLNQSENGETRPHIKVMAEIRARYKK